MRLTLRLMRPLAAGLPQHLQRLDFYSQFHPTAISLKQYIDFGTKGRQSESFMFLRKEVLVRLANIMQEIKLLPESLRQMPSAGLVQEWYLQSFDDFMKFENKPSDMQTLHDFADCMRKVLERHATVVETMAEALLEWKDTHCIEPSRQKNLQYFLNRFYLNRISIRMLMNQHLMLFSTDLPESPGYIGTIDPECDIITVIEDAYHNAQFLCDRYYMTAPEMKLEALHTVKDIAPDSRIHVQVVPNHLYHIMFELFKNSMRATVEFYGEDTHGDELPPIKVFVVHGQEDLSIKIADRGGGVPRSILNRLFNYMYSTAPRPSSTPSQAPLAGYGYGLPLSRLYARYFHGDLLLTSMEGFGTDAHVYLKARPSDAHERVPIYGAKSISKLQTRKVGHDYTALTDEDTDITADEEKQQKKPQNERDQPT